MAIVINGSGTVTGLAVGGLPDGTVDAGTLATNSVDSAELVDGSIDTAHIGTDQITSAILPAGSVLQVVQAVSTTDTQLTTPTTWTGVSPSATITPSSTSSKILVMHSASGICQGSGVSHSMTLLRGSTKIKTNARMGYTSTTDYVPINWEFSYLDSPSTTSAVTYNLQIRLSGTGNVRHGDHSGSGVTPVNSGVTILMEIAG